MHGEHVLAQDEEHVAGPVMNQTLEKYGLIILHLNGNPIQYITQVCKLLQDHQYDLIVLVHLLQIEDHVLLQVQVKYIMLSIVVMVQLLDQLTIVNGTKLNVMVATMLKLPIHEIVGQMHGVEIMHHQLMPLLQQKHIKQEMISLVLIVVLVYMLFIECEALGLLIFINQAINHK